MGFDEPSHALASALEALGECHLAVVTGAGVSLASGIPTFRGTDPEAVWQRELTELGTNCYFEQDPVGSWRWYQRNFDHVLSREPNDAHRALAELERWHTRRGGRFVLVTQNVDPLHERAGSEALVKVHGSADRVRCTRHGCVHGAPGGSIARAAVDFEAFQATPSRATLPTCPACGSLLRQHVLWFDEFYDEHQDYQWERVLEAAATMRLALFVGTSFAVGVTELFLRRGLDAGVPMFAVDPGAAAPPHPSVHLLRVPAESVLPAVCEVLGAT